MMESFWGTMQLELLDSKTWQTREELANVIFEWIECWYNPNRRPLQHWNAQPDHLRDPPHPVRRRSLTPHRRCPAFGGKLRSRRDGRVSRRWCSCWSGRCRWRPEFDDLLGRVDAQLGEDVALGGGELGALPEGAGGAFEGADVEFLQVLADAVPGVAGGGLDDPDQQ